MTIVVDASAVIHALVDSPVSPLVRRRLLGERMLAPQLIDLEVVAVLRRLTATGRLAERDADGALHDLSVMPIRRFGHGPLLERCWQQRANVGAYDAAYVALAELLGVELLTDDRRLARASGPTCRIITVDELELT